MTTAEMLKTTYQKHGFATPELHIVLGSGLASAFAEKFSVAGWKQVLELPFSEVPGLVPATAPGHRGVFRYFRHESSGRVICFQQGRLHGYEGWKPSEVVQPVLSAFLAGTKNFIITNAAGGLKAEYKVGSAIVLRDHVNMTGTSPLVGPNPVGPNGQPLGPRFPDMSEAYDPRMRKALHELLAANKFDVYDGVYLGLLGPCFETPAEVQLYAKWGLDAVGMSTVWEVIALRHAGARLAGISMVSNPGCGLTDEKIDHENVLKEMEKVGRRIVETLFKFAEQELK